MHQTQAALITEGAAMFAIVAAWYNSVRKHQALGTTLAAAAGRTGEAWSIERLLSDSAKVLAARIVGRHSFSSCVPLWRAVLTLELNSSVLWKATSTACYLNGHMGRGSAYKKQRHRRSSSRTTSLHSLSQISAWGISRSTGTGSFLARRTKVNVFSSMTMA